MEKFALFTNQMTSNIIHLIKMYIKINIDIWIKFSENWENSFSIFSSSKKFLKNQTTAVINDVITVTEPLNLWWKWAKS